MLQRRRLVAVVGEGRRGVGGEDARAWPDGGRAAAAGGARRPARGDFRAPDPYMDRDMITARGRSTDELPEMTPTYVAFSTLALFILTISTNVMFHLYIKPSVDGVDQPVRIQRAPLVDPGIQQTSDSGSS